MQIFGGAIELSAAAENSLLSLFLSLCHLSGFALIPFAMGD
jgi:hypothetical protein